MKKLKINHDLARLIQQNKKTSIWRLFDDKDLAVNDDIELIDKVNAHVPASWRVIGIAHVNKIVQKRLGEIDKNDYEITENFESIDAVIETYKKYYGSEVSSETPVKIIHFSFKPQEQSYVQNEAKNTTLIEEAKMHADGGSRGNPGPSASGFVIQEMDDSVVVKKGIYLGITTNNQAEYQALKLGLEEASKLQIQILHIYMDSLLVINQMKGIFKVKNRDLWPIHAAIKELASRFQSISYEHVPRELNKLADRAVNEALDAALKK